LVTRWASSRMMAIRPRLRWCEGARNFKISGHENCQGRRSPKFQ
jgi:hypothetical protein